MMHKIAHVGSTVSIPLMSPGPIAPRQGKGATQAQQRTFADVPLDCRIKILRHLGPEAVCAAIKGDKRLAVPEVIAGALERHAGLADMPEYMVNMLTSPPTPVGVDRAERVGVAAGRLWKRCQAWVTLPFQLPSYDPSLQSQCAKVARELRAFQARSVASPDPVVNAIAQATLPLRNSHLLARAMEMLDELAARRYWLDERMLDGLRVGHYGYVVSLSSMGLGEAARRRVTDEERLLFTTYATMWGGHHLFGPVEDVWNLPCARNPAKRTRKRLSQWFASIFAERSNYPKPRNEKLECLLNVPWLRDEFSRKTVSSLRDVLRGNRADRSPNIKACFQNLWDATARESLSKVAFYCQLAKEMQIDLTATGELFSKECRAALKRDDWVTLNEICYLAPTNPAFWLRFAREPQLIASRNAHLAKAVVDNDVAQVFFYQRLAATIDRATPQGATAARVYAERVQAATRQSRTEELNKLLSYRSIWPGAEEDTPGMQACRIPSPFEDVYLEQLEQPGR